MKSKRFFFGIAAVAVVMSVFFFFFFGFVKLRFQSAVRAVERVQVAAVKDVSKAHVVALTAVSAVENGVVVDQKRADVVL